MQKSAMLRHGSFFRFPQFLQNRSQAKIPRVRVNNYWIVIPAVYGATATLKMPNSTATPVNEFLSFTVGPPCKAHTHTRLYAFRTVVATTVVDSCWITTRVCTMKNVIRTHHQPSLINHHRHDMALSTMIEHY